MAGPATPSAAYGMISIAEAQEIVLHNSETLSVVEASLTEALGLVVAEDVFAKEPLPAFPASIKVSDQHWDGEFCAVKVFGVWCLD